MPTDEFVDDLEMDQALRSLLPEMPRSERWEQARRAELLSFIETAALPDRRPRDAMFDVPLEIETTRAKRRRTLVILAGTAAAVLIAVLASVPRWTEPESPRSLQPGVPPEADSDQPILPDRFPIVMGSDPRATVSTAAWNGVITMSGDASTFAVVAQVADGRFDEGVELRVVDRISCELVRCVASEDVVVAGVEATLYVGRSTPPIEQLVVAGTPNLVVSGLDPVAFVQAAGGFPFAQVGAADGSYQFTVGELPTGYEVIVAPGRLPHHGVEAMTHVPDGDNPDLAVAVTAWSPLGSFVVGGEFQKVDINGVVGWVQDVGPGSTVFWQVSETTWAQAAGAMSANDALTLARAVEFVDEATWRTRYDVPEFGSPTQIAPCDPAGCSTLATNEDSDGDGTTSNVSSSGPSSASQNSTTSGRQQTVPDVRGLQVADATRQLDAANIAWQVVETPHDDVPSGLVAASTPVNGTTIAAGEVVTLSVSSGPATTSPTCTVPGCAAQSP